MRVCRYEGASSTEVKASPCVSQGLRSTRSPDPISVCGAIRPLTLSPERPPVQPHWGQHLWTWWGEERIKSWREVGCKEIGSPFSQHVLWSAMQTGIRKEDLDPNYPTLLNHPRPRKGKTQWTHTIIRSMPGPGVPGLQSGTCQYLQKAGLWSPRRERSKHSVAWRVYLPVLWAEDRRQHI